MPAVGRGSVDAFPDTPLGRAPPEREEETKAMKKRGKIPLHRETLRKLSNGTISGIVGGAINSKVAPTICGSFCLTDCYGDVCSIGTGCGGTD
jgi:hypothetical protein